MTIASLAEARSPATSGTRRGPPVWLLPAGLLLGMAAGWQWPSLASVIAPVGQGFVTLVRWLAVPLLLSTVPLQLAAVAAARTRGMWRRDLVDFGGVSLLAAAVGVLMSSFMVALPPLASSVPALAPASTAAPAANAFGRLVVASLGSLDGWILVALLAATPLAYVVHRAGRAPVASVRGRAVALLRTVGQGTDRALLGVLWVAPLGVFALAATLAAALAATAGRDARSDAAGVLVGVIGAVYLAQVGTVALLLGLVQWRSIADTSVGVGRLLRAAWDALVVAVVTGSSSASLPLECDAAAARLGLPGAVVQHVVLGGVLLCKIGTAAFLGALGGALLLQRGGAGFAEYAALVTAAAALAALTPPVNGGGLVMLTVLARIIGADAGLAATLLALPMVGRLNTPVNVLGRLGLAVLRR